MSGVPMSEAARAELREGKLRNELSEARGDRAQLIAELAEARSKLAELREMERERNAYRHAFERLVGRILPSLVSVRSRQVERVMKDCNRVIERLQRGESLANEMRALVRKSEKRTQ